MSTLSDLISQYTSVLKAEGLADEAYKWELLAKQKGRPNLDAVAYGKEVRDLDYSNLIYGPTSLASLREIAENEPEGLRAAHRILFDEMTPLSERLATYRKDANTLFIKHRNDDRNSGQDERTAATILFFHNSEKYTLYKNSVYQNFCVLLEVVPVSAGKKYAHYLELLRTFTNEHILSNSELQDSYRRLRADVDTLDPNRLLLAQDFLYRMLEQMPSLENKNLKETGAGLDDHIIGILRNKEVTLQLHGDIPKGTNSINVDYSVISEGNPSQRYLPIVKAKGRQNPTDWKDLKDGGGRHHFFACNGWKVLYTNSNKNTDNMDTSSPEQKKTTPHPLNQILYGPPGTGKTYATRRMAVEICERKSFENEPREEIRRRYDELVDEGRIAFSTFHPSMSYEDFVEGIKPETTESDNVVYKIKPGIFLKKSIEAFAETLSQARRNKTLSFSQKLEEYFGSVQQELDNESVLPIATRSGGKINIIGVSEQGNLLLEHEGGGRDYAVSRERLERLWNGLEDFNTIKNIDREFRAVIGGSNSSAMWAVLNAINELSSGLHDSTETPKENLTWETKRAAFEAAMRNRSIEPADRNDAKPHVLIIDEINRGNTPAIFGELITLLEVDKRLGAEEELTVTLPYSKEPFGVPNNLYVIGTMNTADRSVEALDAALRRRFEFDYVGPNPDVLADNGKSDAGNITLADGSQLYLPDFLTLLNERITALRDRDHTIGHAPFIDVDSEATLGRVLAKAVIPLLQEYFYGDDAQLARILGKGFVEEVKEQVAFATSGEDGPDLPTRYTVHDPSVKGFALADALRAGGFNVEQEA